LLNIAEFQAWLREGGEAGPEWWTAVHERIDAGVEQEEARKFIKHLGRAGMSLADICAELGLELEREDVRALILPAKKKKEAS
jgi:hypothetical protein